MSLHAVFTPRSIAIIGASSQVGSVGNDLVKNVSNGFTGSVYPINPKGGTLYGHQVLPSISEVPEKVDLVLVAVPAAIVPQVLEEAGKNKVLAAIIISAGFKEAGNAELEAQIVSLARHYKITLIGPNCLGMINPHLALNASFAPTVPPAGSIAFLSQSGALGVAVLDYAQKNKLGFSKFLSVGNKAAVSEIELLEYLASDPLTKVILLYVEQLSDFAGILEVAQRIRKKKHPKPIIVLKSGQTAVGAAAAQSHTGALAGSDALYDALFRQAGIIRVSSVAELFMFAECFMYNPLLTEDNIAVVTNAGGLGVLVTDALVKTGLQLAPLSSSTQAQLSALLPAAASTHNPVDILGDAPAERYQQVLEVLAADSSIDALAVLLTPQSMTDVAGTAQHIVELRRKYKKPIVVTFLGGERVTDGLEILHQGTVATTQFPESLADDLNVLHQFSTWKHSEKKHRRFSDFDHEKISRILRKYRGTGKWLSTEDTLQLLNATQLRIAHWKVIHSVAELEKLPAALTETLVLKVCSPDALHKSEAHAVVLNVNRTEVAQQYQQLLTQFAKHNPTAAVEGVLVMEQITKSGLEIIIGAVRDKHLGALLACGMGGIFTETFHDVAFGLVPLTHSDALDVIERLQIAQILHGSRGQESYDISALSEALERISFLCDRYPEIAELDCNPAFVFQNGKGCTLVDARIRVF